MPRPSGLKKTGGRQRGTPNKDTKLLQTIFQRYDLSIPDKIAELLPTLEPQKQADILIRLMEYLYPKRKPDQEIVVVEESLCQRCVDTEENTKAMTTEEIQENFWKTSDYF